MSGGIQRVGAFRPYDPMMQMYGAQRFYGPGAYHPMMFRGFQSPIDQMQARFYHHEMATDGMVKGAVGGALGGAGTGAAVGAVIGGLPGAAIGAVAGGVLGLIGGAMGGRSISGILATHHDAEDDGVINGSPLEYGGGHA